MFRKELQGFVQGTEGSGRSKKYTSYMVCFYECRARLFPHDA